MERSEDTSIKDKAKLALNAILQNIQVLKMSFARKVLNAFRDVAGEQVQDRSDAGMRWRGILKGSWLTAEEWLAYHLSGPHTSKSCEELDGILDCVREAAEHICESPQVDLSGSYADGTAIPGISDLDIWIDTSEMLFA
ncbi:unnamed protein product [Cladocopium goreaui]|uniref:Uncharacterized protein n=1 Tax=Cladocopium goreaui TaxID=2562237 RepID=A0A9P1BW84_9DINO|nr:unnamed protein product [Cladocopium goreaui]